MVANAELDRTDRSGPEESPLGDDRSGEDRSVVFVSQQFPPDRSGHASRIDELSTGLAADGWAVTVLAPPPSFPPGEFDRSYQPRSTSTRDGVVVNRLWTWQPSEADPGFLSRMAYYVLFAVHALWWLLVNGRRHDVVVTTTPPISTGLAGLVTGLFGQQWVVDTRDLWIDASVSLGFITAGGALERVSRRYQRFVLHRADSITVTTPTLGERLCESYGSRLDGKIHVIPNGVDISAFQAQTRAEGETEDPPAEPTDAAPAGADDPGDPFVVIYTGNIGHAQDLDRCLEALTRLPPEVTLRLVGGGDAVPTLNDRANELGVADQIEFVGTVAHDQIPKLLSDARVGIAPLKDDDGLAYAMPTKVYEYLGCRLPVVTTGTGELERFVTESGCGIHADNDPASIADAIETLRTDPELAAAAGRRGYEHVVQRYDRADIAADFVGHLDQLVDDQRATA